MTPWTVPTLAELDRTEPACDTLFLGRPRDHRRLRRLLLTLAHRATSPLGRLDPYLPSLPLAADLLLGPELRERLRYADVVDLQWEEYGRLVPLVRRLAPDAIVTCLFHDVNDQRAARAVLSADPRAIDRARRRRRRVRRTERRLTARLDVAFVLSGKDRDLLADAAPQAPVQVVSPPLAGPDVPLIDLGDRGPVLGFVASLGRPENRDAARRLVESLWPAIRAAHPDARLLLVGGGLDDRGVARYSEVPGVELTGFVDDLEAQYRRFRAVLAPLSTGAGVKFKVLEAIIRGLPTITTTVGIEGIEPSLATAVSDDDADLIAGAIDALRHSAVEERARVAARRARELYSAERFHTDYQTAVDTAASHRLGTRRRHGQS